VKQYNLPAKICCPTSTRKELREQVNESLKQGFLILRWVPFSPIGLNGLQEFYCYGRDYRKSLHSFCGVLVLGSVSTGVSS